MISALPKIVAAQYPRPARLSNEGCCYSDEHLGEILAKPDAGLAWADFQTLLTISRCTGTYEELVYFVPLAIRYCEREPEHAADCLSPLVYFMSHGFDHLQRDGLAQPVVDALRELFASWTAEFRVTHYDLAACRAKGWGLEHSDVVDRSDPVRSFVDDLLRYETFAGLAEELVGSLATQHAAGAGSAWFLEYAYECRVGYARWLQTRDEIRSKMEPLLPLGGGHSTYDDTPPWSRSQRIVRLVNDTDLLRRHFDGIESTVIAREPSPTYWKTVRGLLDYPAQEPGSDPAAVRAFSVEDAKAYRPRPSPQADSSPTPEEPRGPLWPKMKAQRERVTAAIEALAPPGIPAYEAMAGFSAAFAAMGTVFRGRVRGFEREMTFRLLIVSGNYALCENESGPLRIPYKDFAAACEAGELVEVPDDADRVDPNWDGAEMKRD